MQISQNGRFCSIKFKKLSARKDSPYPKITQSFLNQTINLIRNKEKTYTFVSFLNAPVETEEKDMDEFVRQHFDFTKVHYPTQKVDDIEYHTGTRVYWCTKVKDHLPKSVHIFRKCTGVIYNGQPARQKTSTTHHEIRQIEFETKQPDLLTQNDQPQPATKFPLAPK